MRGVREPAVSSPGRLPRPGAARARPQPAERGARVLHVLARHTLRGPPAGISRPRASGSSAPSLATLATSSRSTRGGFRPSGPSFTGSTIGLARRRASDSTRSGSRCGGEASSPRVRDTLARIIWDSRDAARRTLSARALPAPTSERQAADSRDELRPFAVPPPQLGVDAAVQRAPMHAGPHQPVDAVRRLRTVQADSRRLYFHGVETILDGPPRQSEPPASCGVRLTGSQRASGAVPMSPGSQRPLAQKPPGPLAGPRGSWRRWPLPAFRRRRCGFRPTG